jgi:hypothetical protein
MNAFAGAAYAFALAGVAFLLCELASRYGGLLSWRRINRSGERPYLQRLGVDQTPEQAWRDRLRGAWRVRLHRFVGPDDAGHHNHPFSWALSLNLSALWGAGYVEEVLTNRITREIATRRVRLFNWIPQSKYHRITELKPGLFGWGCWTLFITGPRVASWGFWVTGRGHVPWRQYNKEMGINAERAEQ